MTPRQLADTWLACALALALLAIGFARVARAAPAVLSRVHSDACRSIALDREPYLAALGDDHVTFTDKQGTHQQALPPALLGQVELGVFFGRDYRIRLAGTAHTAQGDELRYYRSLPGGLRPAQDELGPLGAPRAARLLALLGTLDPEIVCRAGETCLIKRTTGWKRISAPSALERVGLSLGTGFAIAGAELLLLQEQWSPLQARGEWGHANDAFVRGQEAWVVEHDPSRLHHFDGTSWHVSASPVAGPRSLWGTAETLWIAGDGGAAQRDAAGNWRPVPGIGKTVQVLGRSDRDLLLCGPEGVFRINFQL